MLVVCWLVAIALLGFGHGWAALAAWALGTIVGACEIYVHSRRHW